ncbi:MAG: hypothetical protein ACR2JE_14540 [Acidobacteriaceae bacterium]
MQTNPGARLSIVAYKAKPGKETELMSLVKEHVPYLRSIGLATGREQIVATARDGTVLEVFEWVEGGLERAHAHAGLGQLWTRFAAACDFVPLNTLEEAGMMFANFVPVN